MISHTSLATQCRFCNVLPDFCHLLQPVYRTYANISCLVISGTLLLCALVITTSSRPWHNILGIRKLCRAGSDAEVNQSSPGVASCTYLRPETDKNRAFPKMVKFGSNWNVGETLNNILISVLPQSELALRVFSAGNHPGAGVKSRRLTETRLRRKQQTPDDNRPATSLGHA